ncbi:MAG: hypothetical protein RR455_13015 [Bacteroidales bacterium]
MDNELIKCIITNMFTLFTSMGGTWYYNKCKRQKNDKIKSQYDAFISYPMKAISDVKTRRSLGTTIDGVNVCLRNDYPHYTIFASQDDELKGNDKLIHLTDDFEALKKSKEYILIYPKKLASSVLLELGCALCMKKMVTIFVKSVEDLPYLVKKRLEEKNQSIKVEVFSSESELQHLLLKTDQCKKSVEGF